jgi:IK cytokine
MDIGSLPSYPPQRKSNISEKEKHKPAVLIAREDDDDIFVGDDGVDYTVPNKEISQSLISEDMDDSPHNHQNQSHLTESVYGPIRPSEHVYDPILPSEPAQAWE